MLDKRIIEQGVIRELEKQETEEGLIVFLTFTHEDLNEPLRLVSDPEQFEIDDNIFYPSDFNISLLSDSDSPPRANLNIVNVDKKIGEHILKIKGSVSLDLYVIALSEFDLSVIPRTVLNAPVAYVYKALKLSLIDVSGDVLRITGTITSWDYTQEGFPRLRATENKFPALYYI